MSGIPIDHLIITQAQSAWLRKPVHSIQWVYGFVVRETVETHLTNIYGKMGVQSRAEAIAQAQKQGLLLTEE